MRDNGGSTSAKELCCYFHVEGKFVSNDVGEIKYHGGSVSVRTIKEGMTLQDLKTMISSSIGIDCDNCEMKYTMSFDERILINVNNDIEVGNLFQYNDRSGHVYIASKVVSGHVYNDNAVEVMDDPEIIDKFLGLSQQRSLYPSSLGNEHEPMSNESIVECITYEVGGGCSSLLCGVASAPTPIAELNSTKWQGIFSGVMQRFANAEDFKKKLYKFSIAEKFEYTYVKNSKRKMSVKCKIEGCPWRITANAMSGSNAFLRVTKFVKEHIHNAQDNLQVTHGRRSALTSSIIIEEVRNHIDKRPHEIKKTLQREYGVNLTYKQAYRAKEKAMEDIHGRPEQSYMLIPWICQRLKETDEKTVAEWIDSGNNIFQSVFIAYGCCIEGFLDGARHILYIDGSHLSGPYKGTLLSASAYDADNDLFPVALAIVKGETFDDWAWFLAKIKQIVGSIEVTLVSDRHNSIKQAVRAIFGDDRHAYCYRHVKENFSAELIKLSRGRRVRSSWKDEGLKRLDDIAYARTDWDFDEAMTSMQNFCPEIFDWLHSHGDINKWALSKFPFRRWDNITTNLAESFNAWMVKERRHNVAQLIHEHREKVAKKMYAASVAISKWRNSVGPKTDAKVMQNVARAEHMYPQSYGGGRVCVHTSYGDLHVDVGQHECTCAVWQMSGIPCAHACAAIRLIHGNVYDYVEDCYKITAQQKIYRRCMIPVVTIDMPKINDSRVENISDQIFLQPPRTSRPPGRPRTNRRESQFQNIKVYHCSRCHQAGHTKRTCKNPNPS